MAAVDVDPAKVGRDVGDLAEIGRALRVKVGADLGAGLTPRQFASRVATGAVRAAHRAVRPSHA